MESPEKSEEAQLIEFQQKEELVLLVDSQQPIPAEVETQSNQPPDYLPDLTVEVACSTRQVLEETIQDEVEILAPIENVEIEVSPPTSSQQQLVTPKRLRKSEVETECVHIVRNLQQEEEDKSCKSAKQDYDEKFEKSDGEDSV